MSFSLRFPTTIFLLPLLPRFVLCGSIVMKYLQYFFSLCKLSFWFLPLSFLSSWCLLVIWLDPHPHPHLRRRPLTLNCLSPTLNRPFFTCCSNKTIRVAAQCKAGIAGSNLAEGMNVSVVSVVCCHVLFSALSWSLVQRSPTERGVSKWVSPWNLGWGTLTNERLLRHGRKSSSSRCMSIRSSV
jgi:hypothetical protein